MPLSTLGAVFFFLMGLGSIWAGWYGAHIGVVAVPSLDGVDAHRVPASLAWWWRIMWTVAGLGMGCFGLTTLRYSHGPYIDVPANAPFIDHLIWILGFVSIAGFFAVFLFGLPVAVHFARERRTRHDGFGES